jgi:predicted nucleic acid-binding protein
MSDSRRLVADADVLAADLLVGGAAREAMDAVRAHSWLTLVASDRLLDDAAAVVRALADDGLAADWREKAAATAELVEHPAADHPALACAYRGDAAHVLSFDERLLSAATGAALKRVETSVKRPEAFAGLFDAASLYEATEGGEYPGPDSDPRA